MDSGLIIEAPLYYEQALESLPSPDSQNVQLKRQPGGHFAAIVFNGTADEMQVVTQVRASFDSPIVRCSGFCNGHAFFCLLHKVFQYELFCAGETADSDDCR